MLEILEEELNKKKIAYYKITGATDKKERLELCNKFNKDERTALLTHKDEYDVLITSYDLLKRDID